MCARDDVGDGNGADPSGREPLTPNAPNDTRALALLPAIEPPPPPLPPPPAASAPPVP